MIGSRILLSSALLLCLIGGSASASRRVRRKAGSAAMASRGRPGRDTASGERASGRRSRRERRAGAWSEAGRNDPVAAGMSVRTEAAARAVLRVGADLIAFSGGSEADIVKLDDAGTTIALRRGRLGVRLSGTRSGNARGRDGRNHDPERHAASFGAGRIRHRRRRREVPGAGGGARRRSPVFRQGARCRRRERQRGAADRRRSRHDAAGQHRARTDVRRMVAGAEARFRRCAGASPRIGRGHRPRDARRAWRLGDCRRSWRGLVSEGPAARLGAVPLRALALDRPVGLDLDRRHALGFRDLAFRPLGQYRRLR